MADLPETTVCPYGQRDCDGAPCTCALPGQQPAAAGVVERYYVRGVTWRMDVGKVTQPCDCRDPCVEVVRASDYDALQAKVARLEAVTRQLLPGAVDDPELALALAAAQSRATDEKIARLEARALWLEIHGSFVSKEIRGDKAVLTHEVRFTYPKDEVSPLYLRDAIDAALQGAAREM